MVTYNVKKLMTTCYQWLSSFFLPWLWHQGIKSGYNDPFKYKCCKLYLATLMANELNSYLQELMMRKKSVQTLDSRQLTLIENAFFYCNPPEKQKVHWLWFNLQLSEGRGSRKLIYTPYSKMAANKLFFCSHVDSPFLPHFHFKIPLCFIHGDEA